MVTDEARIARSADLDEFRKAVHGGHRIGDELLDLGRPQGPAEWRSAPDIGHIGHGIDGQLRERVGSAHDHQHGQERDDGPVSKAPVDDATEHYSPSASVDLANSDFRTKLPSVTTTSPVFTPGKPR